MPEQDHQRSAPGAPRPHRADALHPRRPALHLHQILKALPGGTGSRLAIYLSDDDEGWYTIPLPAVIIQHRSLPAIHGWLETTVDGSRMVPSDD